MEYILNGCYVALKNLNWPVIILSGFAAVGVLIYTQTKDTKILEMFSPALLLALNVKKDSNAS